MNITRIAVRDIKGIKYIELLPKATTTIIGGRNGQGKSSLLDAIAAALGGRKLCPEKPIRKGQTKGYCEVELDGDPQRLIPPCTVRRDFWLKKDGVTVESKLEVITKEGYRAPSPQTLLGDIVGPLGFDPEAFLRMKPAEQATVLKSLVGLDFTDLDREFTELYRERAKVNDAGKRLKVQYEALPHYPEAPADEVSVAELVGELRKRQAVNADNQRKRRELDKLETTRQDAITCQERVAVEIAGLRERLAKLEAEQHYLEEHTAGLGQQYDALATEVAALAPADTAEVEERIAASEEVNRQVRENAKRNEMAARLEAERAHSKDMTARLTAIEERKDAMRRAAQWPVAGLGYDENGVTYQDLPFDQISASEQRRVAVGIACALQPTLRFFFLKDGSLLDDESKAEFAQLAAEHGCQCFLEVVGAGSEAHIVIEDGEVARADEGLLVQTPTPEPAEEPTL